MAVTAEEAAATAVAKTIASMEGVAATAGAPGFQTTGRYLLYCTVKPRVTFLWGRQFFTLTLKVMLPPITYYWTGPLILDHPCLVGNLTNTKIAETKALETLKS